jgi:knotted carbamoyltransferase YgeW
MIRELMCGLDNLESDGLYGKDFLLTWDKSTDEIRAILLVAEIIKGLRTLNISTRLFDSGIAVSQFRDNSTRTRFSFASACNLLGLGVQDLDEGTSQIAHGETVQETAVMISFMADVIGIRDDLYIGKGHTYMEEVATALEQGFAEGVLEQRPAVINLQCDIDHPTQTMADLLHLVHHFGGVDELAGKKLAMSWAYSPSYGKPLSVPQGIIGLLTRFGMDIRLAMPDGYGLLPEVTERAKAQAGTSGGSFAVHGSMRSAFTGADVVYPKSWAPFSVMEERTVLVESARHGELAALEERCLETNREHVGWECTQDLMKVTNNALYMHCLPADISGVSCKQGEVAADVFDEFRTKSYSQASNKPYIIAAMILCSRMADPQSVLSDLYRAGARRVG